MIPWKGDLSCGTPCHEVNQGRIGLAKSPFWGCKMTLAIQIFRNALPESPISEKWAKIPDILAKPGARPSQKRRTVVTIDYHMSSRQC